MKKSRKEEVFDRIELYLRDSMKEICKVVPPEKVSILYSSTVKNGWHDIVTLDYLTSHALVKEEDFINAIDKAYRIKVTVLSKTIEVEINCLHKRVIPLKDFEKTDNSFIQKIVDRIVQLIILHTPA